MEGKVGSILKNNRSKKLFTPLPFCLTKKEIRCHLYLEKSTIFTIYFSSILFLFILKRFCDDNDFQDFSDVTVHNFTGGSRSFSELEFYSEIQLKYC